MTSTDKPRRRNRQAATITEPATTKRSAVTLSAEFSGGLDLTSIEAAAEALLTDVGIACRLPSESAGKCAKAGLIVSADRVRFPVPLVMDLMAKAPERFTHASRDGHHALEVSTSMAAFGPAITSGYIWTTQSRRSITAADAGRFAAVAADAPGLEYGASSIGLSVPNLDAGGRLANFVAAANRPLIVPSRTPFHARDLIGAACTNAGRDGSSCHLAILASVESALTFDDAFVDALVETASMAQCLVVAPTLLIGSNAPATLNGALVRFAAEAMAGVALAQVLCPRQPVAVGATVADVSMRNGLPLMGTANALAVLGGAIGLARRWNLAFFACGPATSAKGFDAMGTAETASWLTAAYYLGANAVIGAIGAVDLDDGISIEKLIVDAEVAARLGRSFNQPNDDACTELRAAGPGGIFLGTAAARTIAHQQPSPRLASNSLFESWVDAGSPQIDRAIAAIIAQTNLPALPATLETGNVGLIDRRTANLADLAAELYSQSVRDAFGFGGSSD